MPSLSLTLQPVLKLQDEDNESFLHITLTLHSHISPANSTLVLLPLIFGNVPSQRYDHGNPLRAHDAHGELKLAIRDSADSTLRNWATERDTVGDVTLSFTAFPRTVDLNTPIGPRVDLREHEGSLLGAILSMVPLPPEPDKEQARWDMTIEWDLSAAPASTKVASSLGEDQMLKLKEKLFMLQVSLLAVGPTLQRHPPADESSDFGMLWFPDKDGKPPPFDIPYLSSYINTLHTQMSHFFGDPTRPPYRIFLRPSPRAFGGAGFTNSFMLEYNTSHDGGSGVSDEELREILSHEVVHNWPIMQGPAFGVSRAESIWWNEGIATYYQALLPYRFGLLGDGVSKLVEALNRLAQAYYTNPFVVRGVSNEKLAEQAWQDASAQRAPYHRGFMYFVLLDSRIRQVSDGKRGVEDLVLDMVARRRAGQLHGLDEWQDLVATELGGEEANNMYESMAAGKHLIVPPQDCLAHLGLRFVRHDQEMLELGFATSSFNARKIESLVPNSRAEAAGVRDGDRILESKTMFWQAADEIERSMKLVLQRMEGQMFEVEYWPRTRGKVESWRWEAM